MLNPIVLSGAFLGWGLGANDSANVFGIAVHARIIKYWTAVVLTAVFVIAGALVDGGKGIGNLGEYAFRSGVDTPASAFYVMLAAGGTLLLMTLLGLPVSSSQAVIGAIIGWGVLKGTADFSAGFKFFGAWVLTPVGGMVLAFLLYKVLGGFFHERLQGFRFYQVFLQIGFLVAGIFGAYSLGANNVANVTAVYAGELAILSSRQAALVGGLAIALGTLTFSRRVMATVGKKLVPLSPFSGLMVVLGSSLTVYIYARIGIPVSSSQAVVGAVVGVGFSIGARTINRRMLRFILIGWLGTPAAAGLLSLAIAALVGQLSA